jgi:hypothetical protein
MGIWFRLIWALCFAWSSTACGMFLPAGDVAQQTIGSLMHPPVRTSDTGRGGIDPSERSGVSVLVKEPSAVLPAMPADAFFGFSTLHLSQNRDGSISVYSDGRSVSLLGGLDPALVDPAVLHFLFPSCDVPVTPAGISY